MSECSDMLRVERGVEGIRLPHTKPSCADCGGRLREGAPVTAGVERRGATHHVRRLWCAACAPLPGESAFEWLAEADVALISDAKNQHHYPVLIHVTVCEELVRVVDA